MAKTEVSRLDAVWGSGPVDVWLAGYRSSVVNGEFLIRHGALLHWNGAIWCEFDVKGITGEHGSALNDIGGSGAANLWGVGDEGLIVHWDGRRWSTHRTDYLDSLWERAGVELRQVWAADPQLAVIVGHDVINDVDIVLIWDGTRWQLQPPLRIGELKAVWGTPDGSHVFIVAEAGILTGTSQNATLFRVPSGTYLYAVAGSGANDVWAVGADAAAYHWDGSTWTPLRYGNDPEETDLRSIWVGASGYVWLGGVRGVVKPFASRSVGMDFEEFALDEGVADLWGSGPNDVWIAGLRGSIWRWDGQALRTIQIR